MFAFLFVHVHNILSVGLFRKETKPELVNAESASQLLPTPVTTKFSQPENIDDAFIKLSAAVTDIIQHSNLQRACIEKARSPKMLNKLNKNT